MGIAGGTDPVPNLIDGEFTKKRAKPPPLWRRLLIKLSFDPESQWMWWPVVILLFLPAAWWYGWLAVLIAWGFGFKCGRWASKKQLEQDGYLSDD